MTQVVELSDLPAAALEWWTADGTAMLTVVAKATFELEPERLVLSDNQDAVHGGDSFFEQDAAASVYAPADLVPFKLSPEVLLVGRAYAPQGRLARTIKVRLKVGQVDKSLQVLLDRTVDGGGQVHEHDRFGSMPLRYERAARGVRGQNPVGLPLDAQARKAGSVRLPNIIPVGAEGLCNEELAPVGFGPIAGSWPERRRLLAERTEFPVSWQRVRLDARMDPRAFNYAPTDQQLEALHESEMVMLENLHPKHQRLRFRLPSLRPRVFFDPSGRELPMRLDTLWIDTARRCCTLSWRGQISRLQVDANQRALVGAELSKQRLDWQTLRAIADGQQPRISLLGETAAGPASDRTAVGRLAAKSAVPFAEGEQGQLEGQSRPGQRVAGAPIQWESTDANVKALDREVLNSSPAWLNLTAAATRPSRGAREQRPSPLTEKELRDAAVNRGATIVNPAQLASLDVPARPAARRSPSEESSPGDAADIQEPQPESPWASSSPAGASSSPMADPSPVASPTPQASTSPTVGTASDHPALSPTPTTGRRPDEAAQVIRPNPLAETKASSPRVVEPKLAEEAPKNRPTAEQSGPSEGMDLLWFDAQHAAAWGAVPEWQPLLDHEEDAGELDALGFDDEPPPPATPEQLAEQMARTLLVRSAPLHEREAAVRLSEAVAAPRGFEAPWVLVRGLLRPSFDPCAALQATMTLAGSTGSTNPKLEASCERARRVLEQPLSEHAHEALRALRAEVEQSYDPSAKKALLELQAAVERLLVRRGAFLTTEVFGQPHVRAHVGAEGEHRAPVLLYLPEDAAAQLPLFGSIPVRVLAQLQPRQCENEAARFAFRAGAVARVLTRD